MQWEELIERCQEAGVDAFEINFSCPHGMPERRMGMAMGQVRPSARAGRQECLDMRRRRATCLQSRLRCAPLWDRVSGWGQPITLLLPLGDVHSVPGLPAPKPLQLCKSLQEVCVLTSASTPRRSPLGPN